MRNPTSLRTRLLVPLIVAAVVSSIVVAVGSAYMGRKWATEEMDRRYSSINDSLRDSSFPLTKPVIESLAQLTATDWIISNADGNVLISTIAFDPLPSERDKLVLSLAGPNVDGLNEITLGNKLYFAGSIQRVSGREKPQRIQVLFDKQEISAFSRKAALPPLVTGLSTITLITLLMLAISTQLVSRLRKLERRVGSIAEGDFAVAADDSLLENETNDEIGRLSVAIHSMSGQLAQLWKQVHHQESAKLLHQLAGGLAHQLRNTLTGARIAMELHSEQCPATKQATETADSSSSAGKDVQVAIRQLTMAEDYVTRLTKLGSKTQNEVRPKPVVEALRDVESIHEPIARHLEVDLTWQCDPDLQPAIVSDGAAFSAAISNLLLNAMQAATIVRVVATISPSPNATNDQKGNTTPTIRVCIHDNGPGIDPEVAEKVFDPFVTTKPEGMGLGLALVQRVAEQLGGDASWKRCPDETVFEFLCRTKI